MSELYSKYIFIGGSAGSGKVINRALSSIIIEKFNPVTIVRHIDSSRDSKYMELLSDKYKLNIVEPNDKDRINSSTVYFAPAGYHLLIEENVSFALSVDDKINYSRPSIDALFESAAKALGSKVTAILLSGSNNDGSYGLEKIKENGGSTIVEDPESSEFPTMPLSAINRGCVDRVLQADELIQTITKLVSFKENI